MNRDLHDLDDLATLWAEEPSHEEQQALSRIARRVCWRATVLRYWDIGLGIAIAVGVLLAVLLQPAPVTLAVGIVAGGGLLWSSWKRYLLKQQVELLLEVSERSRLIDLQIRRVGVELQRTLVGLVAMPPAFILFGMVAYSLEQGGTLAGFGAMLVDNFNQGPIYPALAAAVLLLILQQAQIARRLREELRWLRMLSGEYRDETLLDGIAAG